MEQKSFHLTLKTVLDQKPGVTKPDLRQDFANAWNALQPKIGEIADLSIAHEGRFAVIVQTTSEDAEAKLRRALPETWCIAAPAPKATLF